MAGLEGASGINSGSIYICVLARIRLYTLCKHAIHPLCVLLDLCYTSGCARYMWILIRIHMDVMVVSTLSYTLSYVSDRKLCAIAHTDVSLGICNNYTR